jgi:hypothetical protein
VVGIVVTGARFTTIGAVGTNNAIAANGIEASGKASATALIDAP